MAPTVQAAASTSPAPPRAASWCPGTHPTCPACGGRLYIAIDRGQTVRGSCRNRKDGKQCPQHYAAVGIGGDVVLVVALSPVEFHDLLSGRKIAGVQPEPVVWQR